MPACLIILLAALTASGTTWRVPQDTPTIQQGLDSLSNNDTLIVSPGIYPEALIAPSLSFVWLGVVDSGGEPEHPVINPPVGTCLSLPVGSEAIIEDTEFRTGDGIYGWPNALALHRCLFDSMDTGLYFPLGSTGILDVISCEFVRNRNCCVIDRSSGRATLTNSTFSESEGDLLAWLLDSAVVENCIFRDKLDGGDWLWLIGQGISVRNCLFGPTSGCPSDVVYTGLSQGCVFEENVFENLEVHGSAIGFNGVPGESSFFRDNLFRNCRGVAPGGSAGGGINLNGQTGLSLAISGCTFDSCTTWSETGFGALDVAMADGMVEQCRFIEHDALAPTVKIFGSPGVSLHECLFERTGIALQSAYMGQDSTDAEFNWWGDPTGPYHGELNVGGLGDTIIGPVDFAPWLLDSAEAVDVPFIPRPSCFVLSAYPNPFNSTATIRISVEIPGIYSVDLYNTLGEHVRSVWSGPVRSEVSVMLDANRLASGIYFVYAAQGAHPSSGVLTKVVLLR